MNITSFLVGVVATIGAEIIALFIAALVVAIKRVNKNGN